MGTFDRPKVMLPQIPVMIPCDQIFGVCEWSSSDPIIWSSSHSNTEQLVILKLHSGEKKYLFFKSMKKRNKCKAFFTEEFGERRRRRRIAGDNPALLRLLKQLRNREINHRDHP